MDNVLKSQNVTVSLLSPDDDEEVDSRKGKWDILVRVAGPANSYGGRPAVQSILYPEECASGEQLTQKVMLTAGTLAEELDLRMQAKRGNPALGDERRGQLVSEIEPYDAAKHAGELFREVLLTAREKGVL